MIIQTIKEYAEEQGLSERTVCRRIISKQLPSYVNIKKLDGRGYVLWVNQCEVCTAFEKACIEFNKRKAGSNYVELAAELSVKYQINTAKLFRMLGL